MIVWNIKYKQTNKKHNKLERLSQWCFWKTAAIIKRGEDPIKRFTRGYNWILNVLPVNIRTTWLRVLAICAWDLVSWDRIIFVWLWSASKALSEVASCVWLIAICRSIAVVWSWLASREFATVVEVSLTLFNKYIICGIPIWPSANLNMARHMTHKPNKFIVVETMAVKTNTAFPLATNTHRRGICQFSCRQMEEWFFFYWVVSSCKCTRH